MLVKNKLILLTLPFIILSVTYAQESMIKSNPNDANSTPITVANFLVNIKDSGTPVAWYIARITGVAAFIMFTFVISSGLLMTSKILLKFKFLDMPDALAAHQLNATFVAFALLLIHIVSLMFDKFLILKVYEALIPFVLERNIKSGIGINLRVPVGLGVIAFYISLILLITSHLRNKIVTTKNWRKIHYLSFVFYVLFVIHGFTSGSDSNEWWMRLIYICSISLVTSLILLRIFGKKYFLPTKRPE